MIPTPDTFFTIRGIAAWCLLCALSPGLLPAGEPVDYASYERLLEKYVRQDGVRYEAWHASEVDRTALADLLEDWSQTAVETLPKASQSAFYINLYNAAMLQAVLEAYPVASVKDIGLLPFSVFKRAFIRLGEDKLSLDAVEKGILFKEYFDPRIHFAVNCASESCPPLRGEAYRGEDLDRQLEAQTRAFAESRRAARIEPGERRIRFSELFEWYADHFPGDHPSVYLNRFREAPLPTDWAIGWIPYDWSLNSATAED